MKRLCFFIACIAMSSMGLHAQIGGTTSYKSPELIPQSPEAANLLKFAETPVSNHTGVPNINIPIVELPGRGLSIPVTLSYHAGGHKVNEESTWVGLGWSLMAGGQITRTVYGKPDDQPAGFISNSITVDDVETACEDYSDPQCEAYLALVNPNDKTASGQYDYQPDVFSFSMMGQSGSFVFNQDRSVNTYGEIIQFPDSFVKITPALDNTGIGSWTIKGTDGTTYIFEKGNILFENMSENISISTDLPTLSGTYTETWNLSEIRTISGEIVRFFYTYPNHFSQQTFNYNEEVTTRGSESLIRYDGNQSGGQQNPNSVVTNYSHTQRKFAVLTKITTGLGEINFIQDTADRLDTQTKKKRLRFVELRDKKNNLIKKVELVHNYFNSPTSGVSSEYMQGTNNVSTDNMFLAKRLYLQELKYYEDDTNSDFYNYTFAYDATKLPHRRSRAQDHWGYYNGATSNTTMIGYGPISGNRSVNPAYSDACILKTITYPEGGTASYTYENNVKDGSPTDYFGGLRVKEIRYDGQNGPDKEVRYEYEGGYILGEPNYYSVTSNGIHKYVGQSWVPMRTTSNSYTGYNKVIEKVRANETEKKVRDAQGQVTVITVPPIDLVTEREYSSGAPNGYFNEAPYVQGWTFGYLEGVEIPNKTVETNFYSHYLPTGKTSKGFVVQRECRVDPSQATSALLATQCNYGNFADHFLYPLISGVRLLTSKTVVSSENGVDMTQNELYHYDNKDFHYNPTRKVSDESTGETLEIHYKYPKEANITGLLSANRINEVIETQYFKGNNQLYGSKNHFRAFNNSTYRVDSITSAKAVGVTSIPASNFESRLKFHDYDYYGNILEVSQTDGTSVSYIWGYYQSQPIAKIENATQAEVNAAIAQLPTAYNTLAKIQAISSNDNVRTMGLSESDDEGRLRYAMNQLRVLLPNALITSFTYDPLIGVTSMTDSTGLVMYYNYDNYNRLESIKDADGFIINAFEYNYKN
jgi:hypothetical protein